MVVLKMRVKGKKGARVALSQRGPCRLMYSASISDRPFPWSGWGFAWRENSFFLLGGLSLSWLKGRGAWDHIMGLSLVRSLRGAEPAIARSPPLCAGSLCNCTNSPLMSSVVKDHLPPVAKDLVSVRLPRALSESSFGWDTQSCSQRSEALSQQSST